MWHKFKIILAALLWCYLPQAIAINILFGERNPICLEAINRMNQDPHFFKRASKEQYHYILLESPFKRDYFEYVPMDMTYPLFLQQKARHLRITMNANGLNWDINDFGYYPMDEKSFSESDFKRLIYDKTNSAEESAGLYYRYYNSEGTNAFAYKTNLLLSDKLHIIGVVSDVTSNLNDKWSIPVEYFIVDEYMHFQPEVLEQYYDPSKDYYYRSFTQPYNFYYYNSQDAFFGVPIDIMGETLAIQIYQGWEFNIAIFRNVYINGFVKLEPICEFSKVVH